MSKKMDINIHDVRMQRPVIMKLEGEDMTLTLQMSDIAKISGSQVTFYTPNNVSIFLSSAKKEVSRANNIYKSLFGKINKVKGGRFKISDKDLGRLYNYFESIQSSIISMYTAIESFANICIPHDYIYERINQKGVKEIYDKVLIERLISTSEKIDKILPLVLECDSPKGTKLWEDFKTLESLRNDIIHPKTTKKNKEVQEDSSFLCNLLVEGFINKVTSGFSLISYFCEKNTAHSLFPMGFGEVKFEAISSDGTDFIKVADHGDEVELPT